jgi:hypothetical protein
LLEGTADIVFTNVSSGVVRESNIDTGKTGSTQVMWLNGFDTIDTTAGEIPAVLGVRVAVEGGMFANQWYATAAVTGLTAGPMDTTVRIYYTYTA